MYTDPNFCMEQGQSMSPFLVMSNTQLCKTSMPRKWINMRYMTKG